MERLRYCTEIESSYSSRIIKGKEVKIYTLSFHVFRRWYINEIVRKKGVYEAQRLARHKHISTTIAYLQASIDIKKEALAGVFEENHYGISENQVKKLNHSLIEKFA